MSELMGSGVELMFVGMGIVFLFLTMLVIAINLMSSLVQRFFPEAPATTLVVPVVTSTIDKQTVAAITAALHQYRNKQK
ncbi:MAG: OadG family transporter subunit [Methylovulum sp.]|nr:OadG family transporter subunit [Methylovulum sp.]